jgi:cellulose biosynthesis protein BcsQ
MLRGKRELDDLVKGSDFENLDLLPSDFSYRHMDLVLGEAKKPAKQLLKLLRPLSYEYDRIFLDCPPSISLVSENIFRAADLLLIPMIPTTLSLRTYQQIKDFFSGHDLNGVRLMPFFSMVDRRKRMHLDMLEQLPAEYSELCDAHIPYASDVERMGIHRAPLGSYAANSPAGRAYEALWKEVKGKLG